MGGCAAEESELGKREWELNDCLREECLGVLFLYCIFC